MNGLLKTLIKPDWDDNPERSEVLNAANLLHVGEFQLIQLAYKIWYNEDLPESRINKLFGEYIHDEKQRKKRGIFYIIIILFVFLATHFMAANYVAIEEPAGFYPPYIEKRVVYPELYEKKNN